MMCAAAKHHELCRSTCVHGALQALAEDLTLVCVLGSGNDYMPATRGLQTIPSSGKGGLWSDYLQLRSSKAWADR